MSNQYSDDFNELFSNMPQFEQHNPYQNPALHAPDPELAARREFNNPIVAAPPKAEPPKIWHTGMEGQVASSFNKPKIIDPSSPKKRYILRTIYVDKHTQKRTRVELTPSMCIKSGCNFDIAVRNGFPGGYNTVPPQYRQQMLEALEVHVREFHVQNDDHIIDEDQLPTIWLGDSKQF